MKKLKKILAMAVGVVLVLSVFGCGSKEDGEKPANGAENVASNNSEEASKDWENTIIEGVEYIDTSRNFTDLSREKTSFYIDKDRTKVITYINENEDKKLQLKYLYLDEQCYAIFSTETEFKKSNNTSIVVADGEYTVKGEKWISGSETLVFDEDE